MIEEVGEGGGREWEGLVLVWMWEPDRGVSLSGAVPGGRVCTQECVVECVHVCAFSTGCV